MELTAREQRLLNGAGGTSRQSHTAHIIATSLGLAGGLCITLVSIFGAVTGGGFTLQSAQWIGMGLLAIGYFGMSYAYHRLTNDAHSVIRKLSSELDAVG